MSLILEQAGNRARLEAATDGRIRYLHLPDMGADGNRDFAPGAGTLSSLGYASTPADAGMPKLCEKCGTYDPTPQLTAASRCPCCGVVYAKLPQPPVSSVSTAAAVSTSADAPSFPMNEPDSDWLPLKRTEVWLSVAAVCMLFAVILFDDDGFVLLLDHANLAFHEAGHLFFGVLGTTLGLYGGTLGQLVFPIVAAVSFWYRRQALGAALSGVWLFENFLNIARYMADARAQLLPLVGGGEHDWYHIFSRWGWLDRDTDVASVTRMLAWLGMIGCMLWLWRRFNAQRCGL